MEGFTRCSKAESENCTYLICLRPLIRIQLTIRPPLTAMLHEYKCAVCSNNNKIDRISCLLSKILLVPVWHLAFGFQRRKNRLWNFHLKKKKKHFCFCQNMDDIFEKIKYKIWKQLFLFSIFFLILLNLWKHLHIVTKELYFHRRAFCRNQFLPTSPIIGANKNKKSYFKVL